MKVTIIQTHLFWEDRKKNLSHFDALLDKLKGPTDLIILPEMFTTGFSMDPAKVAEDHLTVTYKWLQQKAKEKNAVFCGSVAIKDTGKFYNRLHWIEPNGNSSFYDKRHLFRMAKEDEKYTAGNKKIIKQIKEWNIMPLVCYDLRPEVRSYPWKQLLIARAIENQCYVIGLNRVGKDGNDYNHSGDSMIINPRGEVINQPKANEENMETITLDKTYLEDFRKLFPVGLDADDFELK